MTGGQSQVPVMLTTLEISIGNHCMLHGIKNLNHVEIIDLGSGIITALVTATQI